MRILYTVAILFVSLYGLSQNSLRLRVVDGTDSTHLELVSAKILTTEANTVVLQESLSNEKGEVIFPSVATGKYTLQLSYIGYETYIEVFKMPNKALDLGVVKLFISSILTEEVKVTAKQVRVEMKGDTVQFNADAYKVNPDANAEDLIRKMPGIEVENGAVKAQGENVRRVLIDGKEFFGNDPSLALKNLPAEIISKIEVFDRQSDQSQFSGFEDGNSEKTINIVTRNSKSNGEFGKAYLGYGLENRYTTGGNINYFSGDKRLSIIGLSNNVNQQNFASEDLLGALGSSNSSRRGGGGSRGGTGRRPGSSSSADPSNFLVNNQGGISSTNAIGLNFIDKWGEKVEISSSYFFNQTGSISIDTLERISFIDANTQQFYDESGQVNTDNFNHRINNRFEFKMNEKNTLVFTPNLSFQGNNKTESFDGITELSTNALLNSLVSNYSTKGWSYNLRANLSYRHRFAKRGRTFSVGVGANTRTNETEGELESENQTFIPRPRRNIIDQINKNQTISNGYTIQLDFSEPVGIYGQLRLSYKGNFNQNEADRRTFDFNEKTKAYDSLNSFLSNSFLNSYTTHATGVSYRYSQRQKLSFSINLDLQHASLKSDQVFPENLIVNRSFTNFLPFAYLSYRFSPTKSLRLFYRSSTNAPSITQLQNVVNNSNPLQLRAGNPSLEQEFSNVFTLRYNSTNTKKASSLFAYLNGSLTTNNISNGLFTALSDTLFREVRLAKGSQLTLPINYGTSYNISSFLTYGFPFALIKSNINLNSGISYNQTPTLLNGNENIAYNLALKSGMVVGSNISENVDFTISYNGAYNIIHNTLSYEQSNFYSQNVSLKLNILSQKGLFFNTEGINTLFSGLDEFDQQFTLLNMSIGQKFFKNQQGEIKFTAFDLLNQNTSVNRQVTEAYIEDSRSLVLNRYYLLTFTYSIRNFR